MVRVGLCQLLVSPHKENVYKSVRGLVQQAIKKGSEIIILPECFNSPYSNAAFPSYAEEIPHVGEHPRFPVHQTCCFLSELARSHGIYIVGGSIPEIDKYSRRLYNSSTVFDQNGKLIAKHRKVHLFDIDIPGKIRFMESETLSAGTSITHFSAFNWNFGIGICYDLRFADFVKATVKEGCDAMIFPGAFSTVTGPLHWMLLNRSRALDNQIYVMSVSPARDQKSSYLAYGHSCCVDPMGIVISEAGHNEEVLVVDIEKSVIKEARDQIPVLKQRRYDLY